MCSSKCKGCGPEGFSADNAGEEEGFAEKYLQGFLKGDDKHGASGLKVHERFEMASTVTPVDSRAFALVRQAILETLAKDRVRSHDLLSPVAFMHTVVIGQTLQQW